MSLKSFVVVARGSAVVVVTGLEVDRVNLTESVKVDEQNHQMVQPYFAADGLVVVPKTVRVAVAS